MGITEFIESKQLECVEAGQTTQRARELAIVLAKREVFALTHKAQTVDDLKKVIYFLFDIEV